MLLVVVYLDLVIISTILVNYLFIVSIGYLIGERTSFIRICFGLLISVMSLFLYIVPIKYIYNLRYFIGLLIGIVSYKKGKNKVLGITFMYLINLGFIGSLVVFRITSIILLVVVAGLIVLMHTIIHFTKPVIKPNSLTYNVLIDKVKLSGFLDTGNSSSYKGLPLIYINEVYKTKVFNFIGRCKISVVTGEELIDIYMGPKIFVKNKSYKVYYVFSKNISSDVILNINMEGLYDN